MFANDRQAAIIKCMESRNTVSVEALVEKLFVSGSTIRRDLAELEKQGVLRRVHGGAVLTTGSTFDTPANTRRTQQLPEKQRIADLAARFLSSSTTYFFDSSSTAMILAMRLKEYLNVQIATNGLGILQNFSNFQNIAAIATGGYLRFPYDEFVGNLAVQSIAQMNADIFFFSCAGFDAKQGAMELNDENVSVKRAFFQNSKQHILLCDSTKFNHQYFFNSFSIEELDYIITDKQPDDDYYLSLLGDKLIY